jgi:hypothetical protein
MRPFLFTLILITLLLPAAPPASAAPPPLPAACDGLQQSYHKMQQWLDDAYSHLNTFDGARVPLVGRLCAEQAVLHYIIGEENLRAPIETLYKECIVRALRTHLQAELDPAAVRAETHITLDVIGVRFEPED